MAYLRAYQAAGDPFLGGLLKKALGFGAGLLGIGKGPSKGALQDAMAAALAKSKGMAGTAIRKFPGGAKGAALAGGALGAGALAGAAGEAMFGGRGGRRYRRQNVGNIKALRRAMRRVEGFAHLAHQTISFTKATRMKKRGRKR